MRTRKFVLAGVLAGVLSLLPVGAPPVGATESPGRATGIDEPADRPAPPARPDTAELPEQIALPNGFRPEGMVFGYGPVLYVGSLVDGAIYAANARTGEGNLLVEGQAGRIATGLEFDDRTGRLYVSGGATGAARVYDAATGAELAGVQLADPADGATFINDVALTADAAYFTDSNRPVLHRMSLDDPTQITDVPLGNGFTFQEGATNANGIVAVDGGAGLILVNTVRGELYSVDPISGEAALIDLGGADVVNGDGLILKGSKLLVIQNRLNQVAVVQLGDDPGRAEVVDLLTSELFRVPTTGDLFARSLYVVNARFGTTPGPDVDYDVVRVALPREVADPTSDPDRAVSFAVAARHHRQTILPAAAAEAAAARVLAHSTGPTSPTPGATCPRPTSTSDQRAATTRRTDAGLWPSRPRAS